MGERVHIVEAANYLGTSVTSLRRMIVARAVAYIEPPRGPIVFDTDDLDVFLAKYRVEAIRPSLDTTVENAKRVVDFRRQKRSQA